jgi:predicted RNase H-like HicB family nuclease/uncharacterized damage-inducible protein DinB
MESEIVVVDVYLEVGSSGECMAHVLDLPGCFVRANSQEKALAALPDAIRAYYTWLRQHGEDVPEIVEPISLQVAEVSTGFVPFWRGSRAALFAPDRVPVSRDEMQVYFRRAAYSRADLLALVGNLSDEFLDWKASPESMSIREIVRHIGNAEEWYVSRIVDPETLPSEWAHDKDMPIFEFLGMERRTALDRLRRLTDRELANVFYPAHYTKHADEPWTARKAMRRFLEHEREHIGHIREVLSAIRNA